MSTLERLVARARAAVAWVEDHRRVLYADARFVVPLLVAGGLLTTGQARVVLDVLAAVAAGGVLHLATKHAPAPKAPERRRRRR